jgi:hypothetical protein
MRFFEAPPEDFHGKLPFVLTDLISELRRRNAKHVEGIFRLNGSDTEIRRLIDDLNQGRIQNWAKYEDIHVISCALKRYFRSMSEREPIIPNDIIPCLVVTMDLGSSNEQFLAQQHHLLKKIVKMLPRIRALTLGYLIQFLKEISLNSDVNRMTPNNLGICFAPNFVGDGALEPTTALHDQQCINTALGLMIQTFEETFAGCEITDDLVCDEDDLRAFSRPPVNLTHLQHQTCRCQFRHGKIIPFVPICRLLKKFAPPTRSADDGEGGDRLTTLLGDLTPDDEFGAMVRTRAVQSRAFLKSAPAPE